jgi:SAM-dependent methyltransferase
VQPSLDSHADHIKSLYEKRFEGQLAYRDRVWRLLAAACFSRWILPSDIVLDLGAGYCEFINNVEATERYGMDLNPDAAPRASTGVTFITHDCTAPWPIPDETLDVVFTSNFLEHLLDRAQVMATLRMARASLRPGGKIIAMGPNIKYLPGAYWDFFDHLIPLSDASICEALKAAGFRIDLVWPRFLPYTMSETRQHPTILLSIYLRLPFLWRFFGKQFLVVAVKDGV